MFTIPLNDVLDKLPAAELEQTLEAFVAPLVERLPDQRLKRMVPRAVRGILTSETPVITAMARSTSRTEADPWPAAKRLYRFVKNKRFNHRTLFKGLYRVARQTVAREKPAYLVVALDPVNFEKPYTHALEGVSTVRKSTPPDLSGQARLGRGYPAITATVVNTQVPAISYANWFSYTTGDFVSQSREFYRAIRTTRWVFPQQRLRFVADSELDDQKVFAWLAQEQAEFVIVAKHRERRVEIYNPRLDRWESETLQDLVDTVPWEATFRVAFRHAGRTRLANVQFGWFLIRLPETHQRLWVLVAEDDLEHRTLVLLTNVPLDTIERVQEVYQDWRLRGRVEHGYRFDQEQGLDVVEYHRPMSSSLIRLCRAMILDQSKTCE